MSKYRVFCQTENKYVEVESLRVVEECPNNNLHSVREGSLVLVDCEFCGSKDYKRQRAELYQYVVSSGFNNLSLSEKKLASEHFVVSKAYRDTVHTMAEQLQYGTVFHKRSVDARTRRAQRVTSEIYNRFVKADADVILNYTKDLALTYVNYGREGTISGDPEALYDYFLATSGTSYESTGLLVQSFTPYDSSVSGVVDTIMGILISGTY